MSADVRKTWLKNWPEHTKDSVYTRMKLKYLEDQGLRAQVFDQKELLEKINQQIKVLS